MLASTRLFRIFKTRAFNGTNLQPSRIRAIHISFIRFASPSWHGVPKEILTMPSLSPTMTHGTLLAWKKKVGDLIKAGDSIAEIETDKSSVSFDASENGYLAKILVAENQKDIPVDQPIAVVVKSELDIAKFKDYALTSENNGAVGGQEPPKEVSDAPEPEVKANLKVPKEQQEQRNNSRVIASPYARKIMITHNVKQPIEPSGPGGRIIARDVQKFIEDQAEESIMRVTRPQEAQTIPVSPDNALGPFEDIQLNRVRTVIAQRLSFSKSTIPHYHMTIEVRADPILDLLQSLMEINTGKKVRINDALIKASALTCLENKVVNSTWRDSFIRQYDDVHINVAVSTESGLVTPIIFNTPRRGLVDIASTVADLAQRAKQSKLSPQELQAGTFTISNLGMFGIRQFNAIINPPQAAILSIGATFERVGPGGKSQKCLMATLGCDHRIVDGAVGAKWLQDFKEILEKPLKFLL